MDDLKNNKTTPAATIHRGLKSTTDAMTQVMEYVQTHPTELPAALESAKAISEQYTKLIDVATQYAEDGERLRETIAETEKASGWIGTNFSGNSGGGNVQCIPVGNAAFVALWQKYGE